MREKTVISANNRTTRKAYVDKKFIGLCRATEKKCSKPIYPQNKWYFEKA